MKVWQNGDVMNATTLNQAFGELNNTGVYSTERTQIGTWLGRPYYRQVVPITCGSGGFDDVSFNDNEEEYLEIHNVYGATWYGFVFSIPITLSDLGENNQVRQIYFRVSPQGRLYFFHPSGDWWVDKVIYGVVEYTIREEAEE